jgi:hypothetical protein
LTTSARSATRIGVSVVAANLPRRLDVGGQDELDLVVRGDFQHGQSHEGVRVRPQQVDQRVGLGLVAANVGVELDDPRS